MCPHILFLKLPNEIILKISFWDVNVVEQRDFWSMLIHDKGKQKLIFPKTDDRTKNFTWHIYFSFKIENFY